MSGWAQPTKSHTRTVLVTGGNKGIGRACAEWFWRDGHRVVITGRDEAALSDVQAACPGVETRAFDVSDPGAWNGLGDGVDVLVANAGMELAAPLGRTTIEDWRRVLSVNAGGVFLGARAVLPGMRERGWGRIIAVASVAAHQGVRYGTAYAASKHAVVGFVRSIAIEEADTGVTANAVCPGLVATGMVDRNVAGIARATGRSEEEARAVLAKMHPIGRLIQPVEVAAAVAFLASEVADAITGQSLLIDGGGVQQARD